MYVIVDPELEGVVEVITDAFAKAVIADALDIRVMPDGTKLLLMPELETVVLYSMGTAPIDELIARMQARFFDRDAIDPDDTL